MNCKNKVANEYDLNSHEGIEINAENTEVCRICLDEGEKMLRPCSCTGSIGTVHQQCMMSWVSSQLQRSKSKIIKCEICLHQIYFIE